MQSVETDDYEEVRHDIVTLIPALQAFSRTFCRNSTDADDLIQETLAKALGNMDKFERGTRLKSWMFTIMRNTFYTRTKYSNREKPQDLSATMQGMGCDGNQYWSIRGHEFMSALDTLPEHYRAILVLVAIDGESYADAADKCGCAIGTVKSRLNRARQILKEEIDGSD